jgi:hypothetical protein
MKFGILQQPIGTLQIPSRVCKEFSKFAKLMRKIPNELRSQKRNASRSLPVNLFTSMYYIYKFLNFYHINVIGTPTNVSNSKQAIN